MPPRYLDDRHDDDVYERAPRYDPYQRRPKPEGRENNRDDFRGGKAYHHGAKPGRLSERSNFDEDRYEDRRGFEEGAFREKPRQLTERNVYDDRDRRDQYKEDRYRGRRAETDRRRSRDEDDDRRRSRDEDDRRRARDEDDDRRRARDEDDRRRSRDEDRSAEDDGRRYDRRAVSDDRGDRHDGALHRGGPPHRGDRAASDLYAAHPREGFSSASGPKRDHRDDHDIRRRDESKDSSEDDEYTSGSHSMGVLDPETRLPAHSMQADEDDEDEETKAVAVVSVEHSNGTGGGTKSKKRVRALQFDGLLCVPVDDPTIPEETGPSLLKCRLERTKTLFGNELRLVLDDGSGRALLTAQKKASSGNYHIYDISSGMIGRKLKKKGGNYLGKIASASAGQANYRVLLDNGTADHRNELALYAHRRTGSITAMVDGAKPRQICVALPKQATEPTPTKTTLLKRFMVSDKSLDILEQRQPRLINGQYSLNFFGRATIASVKNLQLCDEHDRICFQLGKVGENCFNVDFATPMTPLVAFSLAVSQFLS